MTSASAGRVLATQDAKTAATQLVQLSQQLKDEINKVIAQGEKLAQPNEWDGRTAQQWRSSWDNDKKQLQASSQQLDNLQKSAQQAVQNILQAGGD